MSPGGGEGRGGRSRLPLAWLLSPLAFAGLAFATEATAQSVVPVILEDLHIIVEPVTEEGRPLRMHLASARATRLHPAGVRGLGLEGEVVEGTVPFPALHPAAGVPDPVSFPGAIPRVPVEEPTAFLPDVDGLLGADWLQRRTLTLDYPGRALLLREPGDLPLHGPGERLELLSPGEAGGGGAPRVRVTLAGESMVAAIETASGAELTPEVVAALGDLRPSRRSISRLEAGTFDALRQRNPAWRVLEEAEAGTGEPLLELRGLAVASVELPTVWVLRTPEEGGPGGQGGGAAAAPLLLGGDVLREFRLTLDFVGGVAVFEPAGFP